MGITISVTTTMAMVMGITTMATATITMATIITEGDQSPT